jgi:hypothetical protein
MITPLLAMASTSPTNVSVGKNYFFIFQNTLAYYSGRVQRQCTQGFALASLKGKNVIYQ